MNVFPMTSTWKRNFNNKCPDLGKINPIVDVSQISTGESITDIDSGADLTEPFTIEYPQKELKKVCQIFV